MPQKTRQFGRSNIAPGPDGKRPAVNRHTTSQERQNRYHPHQVQRSSGESRVKGLVGKVPAEITTGYCEDRPL